VTVGLAQYLVSACCATHANIQCRCKLYTYYTSYFEKKVFLFFFDFTSVRSIGELLLQKVFIFFFFFHEINFVVWMFLRKYRSVL
jgi:hypothetical protein